MRDVGRQGAAGHAHTYFCTCTCLGRGVTFESVMCAETLMIFSGCWHQVYGPNLTGATIATVTTLIWLAFRKK